MDLACHVFSLGILVLLVLLLWWMLKNHNPRRSEPYSEIGIEAAWPSRSQPLAEPDEDATLPNTARLA